MSRRAIFDELSKRAPILVNVTFCAALLSAWLNAPDWLNNGLAAIVGLLALALLASRERQTQYRAANDSGSDESRGWIAYELAGNGSPPGFYPLAFFGIVTIILTGLQTSSSRPAWAGLFLIVVWGIVNARYPAEDTPDD